MESNFIQISGGKCFGERGKIDTFACIVKIMNEKYKNEANHTPYLWNISQHENRGAFKLSDSLHVEIYTDSFIKSLYVHKKQFKCNSKNFDFFYEYFSITKNFVNQKFSIEITKAYIEF